MTWPIIQIMPIGFLTLVLGSFIAQETLVQHLTMCILGRMVILMTVAMNPDAMLEQSRLACIE
jgi:hypothetical protein